MQTIVTFDYEDFNTTTRRNHDTRKHGTATVHKDPDGGVYLFGDLGCSKTKEDVRNALIDLLGGRRLLWHSVNG